MLRVSEQGNKAVWPQSLCLTVNCAAYMLQALVKAKQTNKKQKQHIGKTLSERRRNWGVWS